MATKKITELNSIGSVDRSTDLLAIVDASTPETMKGTVNTILGITGNPVGHTDTQTLTNKTLTSPTINTPTLTVNDDSLTIRDSSDTTKLMQFQLSGITTGTTRTLTIPNASTTLVGTDATQTLTNKTITAPTITNPTLTVDTVSEFTGANGVTIDGLNIKDGAITTPNSTPNGSAVQVVYSTFSSVATGTTTIPLDDTIPQNTEGTEFMTLAITPKSATNVLVIDVVSSFSSNTADRRIIQALFQDSTASALATTECYYAANDSEATIALSYAMTAGTTSSTTFKIRAGANTSATVTFNGRIGARLFGAIPKSIIKITEYKAA